MFFTRPCVIQNPSVEYKNVVWSLSSELIWYLRSISSISFTGLMSVKSNTAGFHVSHNCIFPLMFLTFFYLYIHFFPIKVSCRLCSLELVWISLMHEDEIIMHWILGRWWKDLSFIGNLWWYHGKNTVPLSVLLL